MTVLSPLERTLWYEALMRNALAMASGCTDQQARTLLLRVAERWAQLARPENLECEDRQTS